MKKNKGHWKWEDLSEENKEKMSKARIGLPPPQKGKTYEEYYGKKIAKKLKENLNKFNKGITYEEKFGEEKAKETKEKKRLSMLGKNSGSLESRYGEVKAGEIRNKIKAARANQVFPVKDTDIEIKLQTFLKELNLDFITHHYIKDIEHGYQCDIWIPLINLVLEADGEFWHKFPNRRDIDNIRTKELEEKGYRVIRLWGKEINNLKNSQELLNIIK